MNIEQARVRVHKSYGGDFRLLIVEAPAIAAAVRPGQFVHVRVPGLDDAPLRRPFSVFDAREAGISILYKPVGRGTHAMTSMATGDSVSLLGPLGNGFPLDRPSNPPVLIAGGYGVAPLRFLAQRLPSKGEVFIGAASADGILCAEEFRAAGWHVQIATEDGSAGDKGRVTDSLATWLRTPEAKSLNPEFYACGPDGMLKAVGDLATPRGANAWLSLDKHMGCGLGACLACVQRIRTEDGKETWARVCRDGPIFEARQIVWPSPARGGTTGQGTPE